VAADVLDNYPDGVWLAEFAPVTDPALVPKTVALALDVPEQPGRDMIETLVDALRLKHLLLVLDNCEHLRTVCGDLAVVVLRACPQVRLLVTSREGLRVPGETLWRVPSLSLPDVRRLPLRENLVEYEAVRLFIERASAVATAFTVTRENAPSVAQICERLDGIPLAIELAAARVKVLAVEQIASRLDDRFRLLTEGSRTVLPRQQTLRAAMDWCYELLSDPERAVLRRLSVFAGGWSLDAAEAVCVGGEVGVSDILDLLTQLVDKSLVITETHGGEVRYRLLKTVRQYGVERLLEAGEAADVRSRHRDFFLALAERGDLALRALPRTSGLLGLRGSTITSGLRWSGAAGMRTVQRRGCGWPQGCTSFGIFVATGPRGGSG
jgi:predicted ATPase